MSIFSKTSPYYSSISPFAGFDYAKFSGVAKETGILMAAKELESALEKHEERLKNVAGFTEHPTKLILDAERVGHAEEAINNMIDSTVLELLSIKNNLKSNYSSVMAEAKKENK